MTDQTSIVRALISVSNKRGLVEFANELTKFGIELIATGGTYNLLCEHNIPATEISEYTGFPEIFDGRVKTLHPKIHGGILYRRGKDETVAREHHILPIDLVVVNLYPFQQTVAKKEATREEIIENIDIGGPSLLRGAAKNFHHITVVVDPDDYSSILTAIKHDGRTSPETRQQLAKKAFAHTANYDAAIANYFTTLESSDSKFPETLTISAKKITDLRYGENPHQKAAYYRYDNAENTDLVNAQLIQGKELSFNNILDANTALTCVQALQPNKPACVIVKHATPCGAAYGKTLIEAYQNAYHTDPVSAFGGIVALNQPLDLVTTQAMIQEQFVEVLLAPSIVAEATELLKTKPNLRVLIYGSTSSNRQPSSSKVLHSIQGGLLLQQADITLPLTLQNYSVVTTRQPTTQELEDLLFAWNIVRFVKSNAIVYAKEGATYGIGTGQTSRVFSAECAVLKSIEAGLALQGAVMASDAFFPFSDSIELAAKAGISAIIQPGGSKRDAEVIDAANQAGLSMIFTGIRHFRH